MKNPLISIIIVNFNTWHFLKPCITSIKRYFSNIFYEIIIVDNASKDDSCHLIETHFPEIILIRNDKNLGFAKANNQGASIANGKYIFLLNADTLILNEKITEAIGFMQQNNIAVLGPKQINGENKVIQSYGIRNTLWEPILGLTKGILGISKLQKISEDFQDIKEVGFLTGSALLIDAEVIKKYGLFDERYFFNTEERDFLYRLCQNGIRIIYYPHWVIKHYIGSGDSINPFHTINWIKSTIIFEKKHGGVFFGVISSILFSLKLFRDMIVLFVKYLINPNNKLHKKLLVNKDILLWQFSIKTEKEIYDNFNLLKK